MKTLLWAERQKLRKSKIVRVAVFAVVLVALIVYAEGQLMFYGRRYIDGAGWYMTAVQSLATFFVLPAVTALMGSYMICREEQEDVLKSLKLIPLSEIEMTAAKLIWALICSVSVYLVLFLITLAVEAVIHAEELTAGMVTGYLVMYLLNGVGVFLAVSWIIAMVALIKKGYWLALVFAEIYSFAGLLLGSFGILRTLYPILAVFQVSGYYEADMLHRVMSFVVLLICGGFSAVILRRLGNDGIPHSDH